MKDVWVFHGTGGRFASGVFSSRAEAEQFIANYRLSGLLTQYPVGISVYDWAIQENLFSPRKTEQFEPGFIQRFTAARQEHHQYEAGKPSSDADSELS